MASQRIISKAEDVQLFDLSTEQVIAYARLLLAGIALAFYLVPTQPAYRFLVAYLVFAALAVCVSHLGPTGTVWQLLTHLLDIAASAILVRLTDGSTSPFLVFFTFILLSATLRWNWRGVLLTAGPAGLQFVILAFLALVDPEPLIIADDELNRIITLGTYFVVLGVMLGFVGAYRQRSEDRFAKLAAWPAFEDVAAEKPTLRNMLDHAASVISAKTIIVVWEQKNDPYFNLCTWENDQYDHDRELTADAVPQMVAGELANSTFMATSGDSKKVLTSRGVVHLRSPVYSDYLRASHLMHRVVAAPIAQGPFRGHVFAVNCRSLNDGLLPLIDIIAYRTGIELERHFLLQESLEAAKAKERIRHAGEVHDGLLQTLTAASLHLKAASRQTQGALHHQLELVGEIITVEQRRVRGLVDSMRSMPEQRKAFRLSSDGQRMLSEIGNRWDCMTQLAVTPPDATVRIELGEQLYLIFAETIANAVRHGQAGSVAIDIHHNRDSLELYMDDDGNGFSGLSGNYDQASLEAQRIGPVSLCERVKILDGELRLATSARGSQVTIRLPI
ncbi:MAG: histidine kinase [Gammaproteobacteria bacterium]|nr:histidine kinase [Gammaproteobacteria bacterium]